MTYVDPEVGDKAKYNGTRMFWFTDIIANAKNNLVIGQIYTITNVEMASSWTGIKLKETGDLVFNAGWFTITK